MIENQIYRFFEFIGKRNPRIGGKLRDDILDIGTSPRPTPKLFILGTYGFEECFFLYDIHPAYGRNIHDPEYPIECEIASPILETIFDNARQRPEVRFLQTIQGLSVYREIPIEFGILRLGKLPERRPHGDQPCEKSPFVPIIGIYGGILIDGVLVMFRRKERIACDKEEVRLHKSVRIDGGHKGHAIIELLHFHVPFYRISDIRSLYLTFTWDSGRMDDIHDLDGRSSGISSPYPVCILHSPWSTFLGCQKNNDILFIGIIVCDDGFDILRNDIIWFGIDRNDYDMLQVLRFSKNHRIIRIVLFIGAKKGDI